MARSNAIQGPIVAVVGVSTEPDATEYMKGTSNGNSSDDTGSDRRGETGGEESIMSSDKPSESAGQPGT